MFYTKIPRKSLALLLISLIFTLAAVGIMFIIYFFNANNSLFMKPLLKQIYSESYHHYQQQQQQQQQQQMQMKQHRAYAQQNYNTKDTDGISYQPYGIGINTHMIKYLKKDTNKHHQMKNTFQQGGSDEDGMHEIEVNDDNNNNNNGKNNNYYTNSDTIYIDDYDRNDKIDWNNNNNKLNNKYINNNDNSDNDLLGINNIDYFETIIMDHKKSSTHNNNNNNDNNNNNSNNNNHYYNNNIINKSEKMIATQASINSGGGGVGGNDEDILIFTKSLNNRRNKLNKIKENSLRNNNNNIINKKDNVIHNNNSDDENRDNETIGSGSGDFIDDTELDEDIFIKTKPRLRPLRRNNKLRSQKNHRISGGGIERRSDINILSNESPPPIDVISNETALPSSYSTLSSSLSTSSALSSSSSLDITMPTVSSLSLLPQLTSSMQPIQQADIRKTRINKLDRKPSISSFSGKKWMPPSIVSSREVAAKMADDTTTNTHREYQNGAWLETRARRIMGNVKKSEEKSRQLLLCEEAGGGELCRMLFKGYLNE